MVKNQKPSCTSKRDTPFKIEHAIEYGLEITQRDPQTLHYVFTQSAANFVHISAVKNYLDKNDSESKQQM